MCKTILHRETSYIQFTVKTNISKFKFTIKAQKTFNEANSLIIGIVNLRVYKLNKEFYIFAQVNETIAALSPKRKCYIY